MRECPAAMARLEQEHANMAVLLDLMESEVAALRRGEKADLSLVEGITDYFLTYPDLVHHPKEDLLFHRLRATNAEAAARAEALLSGHEALGLLARRLARALVDHLLQDTSESQSWLVSLGQDFIDTNRRHMLEEEKHFFPLLLRTLDAEDWAAIDDRLGNRDDPLFGAMIEERFRALHHFLSKVQESSAQ